MIRSRAATTDVMSSLPLIGCCVVAVMVLLAAIGQDAARTAHNDESISLDEGCSMLLSKVLGLLTSVADDGVRYLTPDWKARMISLQSEATSGPEMPSSIIVRVFNSGESKFSISGNISLCRDVKSSSEPVLLVTSGDRIPGEIIVMVGA